jgi:diaminopimelate epimerase
MHISKRTQATKLAIVTTGGRLSVSFSPTEKGYEQIVLQGPAQIVYEGNWELK